MAGPSAYAKQHTPCITITQPELQDSGDAPFINLEDRSDEQLALFRVFGEPLLEECVLGQPG